MRVRVCAFRFIENRSRVWGCDRGTGRGGGGSAVRSLSLSQLQRTSVVFNRLRQAQAGRELSAGLCSLLMRGTVLSLRSSPREVVHRGIVEREREINER